MDKLKLLYKLSPIILLIIVIFSIYFAYQCFEDEQTAKQKMTELSSQMQQLQQTIERNNQIIAATNNQNVSQKINQFHVRSRSKNNSKIMTVLVSSCLCLSLVACTTERKVYVNQPIPANLLSNCIANLPPPKMTFGDSIRYKEHLLNVIEMCNQIKKAIKEIIK